MDNFDVLNRIDELECEIAALAQGSISVKKVRGKEYYYHRITQNKKRTETYIDFDKVEPLRIEIEKRKILEAELKKLRKQLSDTKTVQEKKDDYNFSTYVRIGTQLKT